jgi:hypothetical protein
MSDDYLWDRSGEPDPEIVRLEKALGHLRHQPEAVALPQLAQARRPFFPALAAAAVILLVLSGGLWLALRRSINDEKSSPRVLIATPVPNLLAGAKPPEALNNPGIKGMGTDQPPINPSQAAQKLTPRRANAETRNVPVVAKRATPGHGDAATTREGEEAVDKLMMALRFASSKLNLVQKKIQVNKDGGPAS